MGFYLNEATVKAEQENTRGILKMIQAWQREWKVTLVTLVVHKMEAKY